MVSIIGSHASQESAKKKKTLGVKPTDNIKKEPAEDRPTDQLEANKPAEDRPTDQLKANKPAENRPSDQLEAKEPADDRPTGQLEAKEPADDRSTGQLEAKEPADERPTDQLEEKEAVGEKTKELREQTSQVEADVSETQQVLFQTLSSTEVEVGSLPNISELGGGDSNRRPKESLKKEVVLGVLKEPKEIYKHSVSWDPKLNCPPEEAEGLQCPSRLYVVARLVPCSNPIICKRPLPHENMIKEIRINPQISPFEIKSRKP